MRHAILIPHYLVVPEAQYGKALRLQPLAPGLVLV